MLLEISGGVNKRIARSISVILSSLISLNCVSTNVFAGENTKSVTKHAGTIVGTVGAVVVPVLVYKFLKHMSKPIHPYLQAPETPVSADTWFENLGGKNTDINDYFTLKKEYRECETPSNFKNSN